MTPQTALSPPADLTGRTITVETVTTVPELAEHATRWHMRGELGIVERHNGRFVAFHGSELGFSGGIWAAAKSYTHTGARWAGPANAEPREAREIEAGMFVRIAIGGGDTWRQVTAVQGTIGLADRRCEGRGGNRLRIEYAGGCVVAAPGEKLTCR